MSYVQMQNRYSWYRHNQNFCRKMGNPLPVKTFNQWVAYMARMKNVES